MTTRLGEQWLGQRLNYCIHVVYRVSALPKFRHMLNRRQMPTREQSRWIRLRAPEARSYESSEDSEWTKSPHRGTKTNGMALRGGSGNTPHDHPRRESHR